MPHETDSAVAAFFAEVAQKKRLWHTHGMPGLGTLHGELFGEGEVPDGHLKYELLFWNFHLRGSIGDWETYYCPDSYTTEDGTHFEFPRKDQITKQCLDYWESRAFSAQHPLLKARYADAVWDLTPATVGGRPNFNLVRVTIANYREAIIAGRIDPPGWPGQIVARLFYLCTSTGQRKELETTFAELFEYCQSSGNDEETYIHKIKTQDSAPPTVDQKIAWMERDFFHSIMQLKKEHWVHPVTSDLVTNLRDRLDTSPLEKGARWSRQHLAIPLAHYYWKTDSREDAHAVLLKYGEAVEDNAAVSCGLQAVGALEQLAKLYDSYELHDDKKRIRKLVEERQIEVPSELKRIGTQFELKKGETDQWVNGILRSGLVPALHEIALRFMPKMKESRLSMEELAKAAPVVDFLTKASVDAAGRTTSIVGKNDDDGRLMAHYVARFRYDDVYLQILLPRFVKEFELVPHSLVPALLKSDLWIPERHAIVDIGVQAFFNDDFLISIHLLIPEIESAIRVVARALNVSLQKQNRYGGYDLRNVNDLLVDETVRDFLTEDLTFYLRSVLCDQRGWNLRNNLCHGIARAEDLGGTAARRVFLIVLLLSHIRLPNSEATLEEGVDAEAKKGAGPL